MTIKLGVIGAGKMAARHMEVFQKLGIDVHGIASRPPGRNIGNLRDKFNIEKTYNSWEDMAKDGKKYDAFLITTPPDISPRIVKTFHPLGKPILIEKPLAISESDFEELSSSKSNIFVAYNRRFYESVDYFKKIFKSNLGAVEVLISEEINNYSSTEVKRAIVENSVHILDLCNYLFGSIKFTNFTNLPDQLGIKLDLIDSKSNYIGTFELLFNCPINTSIKMIGKNLNLQLKPIEHCEMFNSMVVNEPTQESPIRTYSPQYNGQGKQNMATVDLDFKPGLMGQAKEFIKIIEGNYSSSICTFDEAYKNVVLAIEIAEFYINKNNL